MELKDLRKELHEVKGLGEVTINKIMEHLEKKNFIQPHEKYCYSWDDEDYSNGLFDSVEEALKEARNNNTDECTSVWIGTATKPKLRWHTNEEQIIDSMNEILYEDCGEWAENALDISTDQEIDLANMIHATVEDWVEKHNIKPNCYVVYDGAEYILN